MRFLKSSLILTASLFASIPAAHAAPLETGCGDDGVQYKVKTSSSKTLPEMQPGKAQIVFIQSLDGDFDLEPVSRAGIDGSWVGANKGYSYFAVSVSPGVHSVCINRQTSNKLQAQDVAVYKVDAVVGKTYFLAFNITRNQLGSAGRTGSGGFGSPTGQSTPDMTSKRRDTFDESTIESLTPEQATLRMQKKHIVVSTPK